MKVYIFGNGNTSFSNFEKFYLNPLQELIQDKHAEFIVGDCRGVDTLIMEYLKTETANVSVIHIGERPRYLPDKYKTKVSQWKIIGGFEDDSSRDNYAIDLASHFLGTDFNSNEKRKSGTQKNIERCLALNKIRIINED